MTNEEIKGLLGDLEELDVYTQKNLIWVCVGKQCSEVICRMRSKLKLALEKNLEGLICKDKEQQFIKEKEKK